MNRLIRYFLALVIAALAACPNLPAKGQQPETADLVVYGATPSGIIAAVAAARQGLKVVVLEPGRFPGGMVAGGLSRTDVGNPATIGGITREFFVRASRPYDGKYLWTAEPHVYLRTFREMLTEAGVTLLLSEPVGKVVVSDGQIRSLGTGSGKLFRAGAFIDASYEGDLMAKAGVSYVVGREGKDRYDEEFAGVYRDVIRNLTNDVMLEGYPDTGGEGPSFVHGTPAKIPGLKPDGQPLAGVTRDSLPDGSPDKLTQSYTYRLAVTQDPANKLPWPKPRHYDPANYELLWRLIQAYPDIPFIRLVNVSKIANGKFDLNAQGLFSTDFVGGNTAYPDGDAATRARIVQDHEDYVKGFFWFLTTDPRVPARLRSETASWGLCKDEFTDNDHWPYQLYVREARRMTGEYVMTQMDCQENILKKDAVAMGSFIMDSHIVQRVLRPDGSVLAEGAWDVLARPYKIPYRSIVPRKNECRNLLVTVCLSASHVAYGSIRMEPVYMMLGHAAGVAASLAIQNRCAVQDISIPGLQRILTAQKQVLSLYKH